MRIGFLLLSAHTLGGTERAVLNQAEALAALDHEVTVLSVLPADGAAAFPVAPTVVLRDLADGVDLSPGAAAELRRLPSRLVPARWDGQFSAFTDLVLEPGLRGLDLDVLVTVTPALLALAVQLTPDPVVVVHQEHRSTSQRTSGMEALLAHAPRADVVATLTPSMAGWLARELGPVAPEIVAVPNALAAGYRPRSLLDSRTIVAAGRLVMEKQYIKLVQAFAAVADDLPGWRLRIFGTGHQRPHLVRETRKHGLYDRVELPGATQDMAGEWARASVCALTSRAEGFPLNLQEAMAAGVPCVSFDCASGPREIIDDEVDGLLVAPESVAALSATLLRLGRDDALRARLGAGALAASARWESEAIAERWVQVFRAAMDRRAGRSRMATLAGAAASGHTPGGAAIDGPPPEAAHAVVGVTPAAARGSALTALVDAARRTGRPFWVVPPHGSGTPVVALPMAARRELLTALAEAGAPSYLSLVEPAQGGWPERRGTVADLAPLLARGRTSLLALEPWPVGPDGAASLLGQGCRVEIELWEAGVDGRLVSPRLNHYLAQVPPAPETVEVEVERVRVPTLPLLAAPTVHEVTFPVDAVVTWVDGDDPAWDAARRERLAGLTGEDTSVARTRASSGRARYVSRDELRSCLRSLHLFAPWLRRIHLVTAGQVPAWLDSSHPSIALVDHRDILPADALPTFNSHAIEAALHHVPDLAEHVVYLNDDFLLARPLRPESLFTPSGLNRVFSSPRSIGLDEDPDAPPFLLAARHNRRLLQDAFGVTITDHLAHAPYPLRRSVMAEIEQRFPEAVAATQRSPFRSATDVSMASSLAPHYGLITGTAVPGTAERAYVNIANSDLEWQLRKTLRRDQDFICIADHHDHALDQGRLTRILGDFLSTYVPVPAPWER